MSLGAAQCELDPSPCDSDIRVLLLKIVHSKVLVILSSRAFRCELPGYLACPN